MVAISGDIFVIGSISFYLGIFLLFFKKTRKLGIVLIIVPMIIGLLLGAGLLWYLGL